MHADGCRGQARCMNVLHIVNRRPRIVGDEVGLDRGAHVYKDEVGGTVSSSSSWFNVTSASHFCCSV